VSTQWDPISFTVKVKTTWITIVIHLTVLVYLKSCVVFDGSSVVYLVVNTTGRLP